MTEPNSRPPWLLPLAGLGVFLAVTVFLALIYPQREPSKTPVKFVINPGVSGAPDPNAKVALEVKEVAEATAWVDVAAPGKVKEALFANPWLQDVLKQPLGQGFLGGWGPFLGSRGEDLKGSFKGAVLDLVAGQLLTDPFRVAWLSTQGGPGLPVVLVENAGASATSAFRALEAVARRGGFTAKQCPGAPEPVEGAAAPAPAPEEIEISRWLLAEHSVFAGLRGGRMVLGRQPKAVLQGLCAPQSPLATAAGADVALAVDLANLGRDGQTLAHALGLQGPLALSFQVDGNTFKPTGLSAKLASARFGRATLSSELLKLIPGEVPVVLALNVALPERLDEASLKAFLAGKPTGAQLARQIAIAWHPRGDRNLPPEVAIAWGRAEDAPALAKLFSGPNPLASGTHCGHAVLASSAELLARMAQACEGKVPNLAHAAPAVVGGLAAPSSVTLGVDLGKLLSQLTSDGFLSETPASPKQPLPKGLPPELDSARRVLEALPYVGFRGVAEGGALVGGGFRS